MKLLVSDFDDTLFYEYDKDRYLKNVEKIKEFVNKGNMFIIATGRSFENLKRDIKGLDIPYSYLVCNDGAVIYDRENNIVFQNNISDSLVEELYDLLLKSNVFSNVVINDNYGEVNFLSETNNGIVATHQNYEEANELKNYIIKKYENVKVYVMGEYFTIRSGVTSKGMAIKYLIDNHIKINNNNVYAVGDHVNDISMFQMFNGYAVYNAHPDLLNYSKGVVKSVGDLITDIK